MILYERYAKTNVYKENRSTECYYENHEKVSIQVCGILDLMQL